MASALEHEVTTRRWRRVEYERLVDLGMFEGERLELLDGVLVVREPQGSAHAAIVTAIGEVLRVAFGPGWHVRLHAPLALDDHSEPEPDVAVVAGAVRDYLDSHPATAALVVEVADSSLRLDRRFKAALYARAGLPEYWIVDLVHRALEVHREPQPGRRRRRRRDVSLDRRPAPARRRDAAGRAGRPHHGRRPAPLTMAVARGHSSPAAPPLESSASIRHTRLHMRTTLNLDDDLIQHAARLTGLRAKTDVIHEGLRALIARESARRLAALGGTLRTAKAPPRRRPR